MLNRITEQDINAIREAAEKLYFVSKDKEGKLYIELSADYIDDNKFLLPVAYEHRDDDKELTDDLSSGNNLMAHLQDTISEVWFEAIWMAEDRILREAGFDPNDGRCEAQKEWLRDNIPVYPPYEHYLNQTMRINILLCASSEPNHCFSDIHNQYLAMAEPERLTDGSPEACRELLEMDTSLRFFVEQQGYTMEALAATMKEYKEFFYDEAGLIKKHLDDAGKELSHGKMFELFQNNHSKFLSSLCQELENQRYKSGFITVLAEVSMVDFSKMMKDGSLITMPVNSMCGIFSPDNGAGSVLEVELEKPYVFSRDAIYDVQIEGADPDWGYNLDSVYGLVHSCWKRPTLIDLLSVEHELETTTKSISSTLDDMLKSAASRASAQHPQTHSINEPTR